jgi:hypothetical protein
VGQRQTLCIPLYFGLLLALSVTLRPTMQGVLPRAQQTSWPIPGGVCRQQRVHHLPTRQMSMNRPGRYKLLMLMQALMPTVALWLQLISWLRQCHHVGQFSGSDRWQCTGSTVAQPYLCHRLSQSPHAGPAGGVRPALTTGPTARHCKGGNTAHLAVVWGESEVPASVCTVHCNLLT